MFEWIQSNGDGFFLNTLYDIFKFAMGYLVAQWLYEGVYKKKKYGGWELEVMDGEKSIATRTITPHWGERIFKDDYDFSLYVKGFASPFVYLNMDISSQEAKAMGLITIEEHSKKIIIDRLQNPETSSMQ